MDKLLKILVSFIILTTFGCSGPPLIKDLAYLKIIHDSFSSRRKLAANRDKELFSVFDHGLSNQENEALRFLYAFMPLNDLADYDGNFFLANVKMSLRARSELTWGKEIPDDIFLHYVLPCRVNNENLDSFRIVYYNELKNRIKGLDLQSAALEINHWCHEKVSYLGADSRTSAPISTILSARGRCGEESTFLVAALRTAGIPSRQVYTPRWAHTDDNHAWVEIWSSGQWNYFGACEPEAVLDHGWFTEPARRAMLVHSKSFGAPFGKENVINKFKNFTDVNNLVKYAVTKKISVKVTDNQGKPANDADVEYQLYNYAEFYPLAVVPTDSNGISQFETGLGDLLIWAHKEDMFSFKKVSVSETDTLKLQLNSSDWKSYGIDLDLDVPVSRTPYPPIAAELAEKNGVRLTTENSIRQKYIDSWMKKGEVRTFASGLKLDSSRVISILSKSMGNYKEIKDFIAETPDSLRTLALTMLETVAEKDLRDTKKTILMDHLKFAAIFSSGYNENERELYNQNILNPRVANEILVAWRGYFRNKLPVRLIKDAPANPLIIAEYLSGNIRIAEDENFYLTPITPIGVNELRVSDIFSRSICFVAICRSLGIPSRLEPGSNVPQYYLNNSWNDLYFPGQKKPDPLKGFIRFFSNDSKPVPEYYTHFTLARFENGRYKTLEYDYNRKITDFTEELALDPGHYMLVTGNRLNDKKILAGLSFFDLAPNEHRKIEIKLRQDHTEYHLLGKIDFNLLSGLFRSKEVTSQECSKNGTVIIWIEPEKEPTKHIFNDLPLLKGELNGWGGKFFFLSGSDKENVNLKSGLPPDLPDNSLLGIDPDFKLLNKFISENKLQQVSLPYVIECDNKGNILFTSSGYRIGIGEQIIRHLK